MERPSNCPDSLWTLMQACWRKPNERPNFEQILTIIEDILLQVELAENSQKTRGNSGSRSEFLSSRRNTISQSSRNLWNSIKKGEYEEYAPLGNSHGKVEESQDLYTTPERYLRSISDVDENVPTVPTTSPTSPNRKQFGRREASTNLLSANTLHYNNEDRSESVSVSVTDGAYEEY
eukprot:TRINITY_DN2378_c2_g1_i2.p1 TRINITY_DN2378_c2_g1~~TRINITY_DN2378_c2_g1_i2.p1  ORF type:complete len:197 (-),score=60.20 TRINITY_DN2378_c2_g1_i2:29-559(-)